MVTFSVIVPVYNVAAFLHEALESVLRQSNSDWECICIDDGSDDGSGMILDEYAALDARFRVFHQNNAGVSAARNAALDKVHGNWICFLDADDALHPQLFENLQKYVGDDEIDIISFCHESGTSVDFDRGNCRGEAPIGVCDLQAFIPLHIANKGMWENVYRHYRAPDVRFKPYSIGEDKLFLAEWICRSRKAVSTGIKGYWYRTREGSAINSSLTLEKIKSNFYAGKGMLELYASKYPNIDKRIIRGECVRVSEYTANDLAHIASSVKRSEFIREWCTWLGVLASTPNVSRWFMFVFFVVGRCHSLWRVLLLLPFRVKLIRNQLLSSCLRNRN